MKKILQAIVTFIFINFQFLFAQAPGGMNYQAVARDVSGNILANQNICFTFEITNGNGGVWTNASDRNLKENIIEVNGAEVLTKINQLPISQWNYKREGVGVKHIGPMAQDFYNLFACGSDDKSISTIDPAGISLRPSKSSKSRLTN